MSELPFFLICQYKNQFYLEDESGEYFCKLKNCALIDIGRVISLNEITIFKQSMSSDQFYKTDYFKVLKITNKKRYLYAILN